MKHVSDEEWAQLKEKAARHLLDPTWLGGAHYVHADAEPERDELDEAGWPKHPNSA